jgi:hypothetical protein
MKEAGHWLNGWILVAWFSLAALFILLPFQFHAGFTENGLRAGIRLSGRISTLLFITAFLARPLFLFRQTSLSRWLVKNRRYIGVSFASSHTMHLLQILAFAIISQAFVNSLNAA